MLSCSLCASGTAVMGLLWDVSNNVFIQIANCINWYRFGKLLAHPHGQWQPKMDGYDAWCMSIIFDSNWTPYALQFACTPYHTTEDIWTIGISMMNMANWMIKRVVCKYFGLNIAFAHHLKSPQIVSISTQLQPNHCRWFASVSRWPLGLSGSPFGVLIRQRNSQYMAALNHKWLTCVLAREWPENPPNDTNASFRECDFALRRC